MKAKAELTLAGVRKASEALRRKVSELAKDVNTLCGASTSNSSTALTVLQKEIHSWTLLLSEIKPHCAESLESLKSKADSEGSPDQLIARELRAQGRRVDGDGASLFIDGVVHLVVSSEAGNAKVNDLGVDDLTPGIVAKKVAEECDRLSKVALPEARMLALLLEAYECELRLKKRESGTQVESAAIHFHLAMSLQSHSFRANPRKEHFQDYSKPQFRADLFRLMSSGKSLVTQGQRFKYTSGADTKGSIFMYVPSLNRTAHVTRIWFEAAD